MHSGVHNGVNAQRRAYKGDPMALKPARPDILQYLRSSELQELIKKADAVFCTDERTGKDFMVFGQTVLQQIVDAGESEERTITFVKPILYNSEELEALLDAVRIAKGRHEHNRQSM
jgi:hypothetical protein